MGSVARDLLSRRTNLNVDLTKMRPTPIAAAGLFAVVLSSAFLTTRSQDAKSPRSMISGSTLEYATVRFMEERTSIVWPDGKVENVIELAGKRRFENGSEKYPKGSDYRMYWLTVAMNVMAQRGFELAHMHDNDVVMKRSVMH